MPCTRKELGLHIVSLVNATENSVYNVQRNDFERLEVIEDNDLNVFEKEISREHRR